MVLAMLLVACSTEQANEAAHEEVIDQMEAHWDDAEDLRDAAIAGDAPAFRKAATSLHGRLPLEGLATELTPMEELLKKAAAEARDAGDNDAMGASLGSVVGACGACHEAAGVTPSLDPTLPPPAKDGEVALEMLWHQLAAAELWSAIVKHDAEAWSAGIDKLEKAVYRADDGTAAGSARAELEARAQAIAQKARGAADTAARAEAYGRLIATCSACHTLPEEAPGAVGGGEGGKSAKKGKKGKKR